MFKDSAEQTSILCNIIKVKPVAVIVYYRLILLTREDFKQKDFE
jgi:hypothetical protein